MSILRRRIVVKDPVMAVEKWVQDAHSLGQLGNGVVFCSNEKDVNLYMRIVEDGGFFPTFVRTRTFNGPVSYSTDIMARLDIMQICNSQDTVHLGSRSWPFMVFHNAALWPDRTPIRLLLPRLTPTTGARTTLISVGTDLVSAEDEDQQHDPKQKEIDWLAITRAISNG